MLASYFLELRTAEAPASLSGFVTPLEAMREGWRGDNWVTRS